MKINLKILNNKKRQEIINLLNENYGISNMDGRLIKLGKGKVRLSTSNLSNERIMGLNNFIRIELIGIYLCKIEKDGIRLSHDSTNLFKEQITKNIFEAENKQVQEWLKGQDILLNKEQHLKYKDKKAFVVIKHNNELIGCGKLLGEQGRITNFVPKSRRIKN